jgi:hypothetical protein
VEKPSPATVAWYLSAVPNDPRAVKGQMFGHPCAFVNGNMFFGTFAQSVVARVGEARAAELAAAEKFAVFEPMPKRPWKEYVIVPFQSVSDAEIAALAAEALEVTATMPAKEKKAPAKKAPAKKAPAKKAPAKKAPAK